MKIDKPWDGRFSEKTDKLVEEFTASVHFDSRLALYDIQASIAHVRMLGVCGIISPKDAEIIIKGLEEIREEILKERFKWRQELEDVHMNIEAALREKIGSIAGKLHTGRSRNDQVVTDMRLYLREEIDRCLGLLIDLRETLVKKAKNNLEIIIPGFTHLQHAQPVLLAHYLHAYYEMFRRDSERLVEIRRRVNVCPLGSAALAGTTFPIDREMPARELGFEGISKNSMDAVADRDFILEFMSVVSICFLHLSRLMEEFVLWMSPEFSFIDLPDRLCTGSSIMPQKKNPDVAELIRGKSGRIFGHLIGMFTTLKGLPLTYNRDLQEDKEGLFDTVETFKACLKLTKTLVEGFKPNPEKMRAACEEGFLTATDLADYLVTKGLAFRDAHRVVGKIVSYCLKKGIKLWELPLEKLQEFSKLIHEDVYDWLTLEGSIARRKIPGGTAPEMVKEAIKKALAEVQEERERLCL